ncbi:MAG TPA: transglutaminase [Geobacter sp.]|nr:transglutaminase [Geobacter sp.]
MNSRTRLAFLRLLLALVLILLPLQALAASIPKLAAPPEGERWFSIYMGDERVGFGNLAITRSGDGYLIESQGSVKMKVMGFSREATSKESYLVGPDLALRSFSAENRIDGSPVVLQGEVTPKGIRVVTESGSGRKERTLKPKGTVYSPHALNLYPLMRGAVRGKSYKLAVLDLEATTVKQFKVEVVGEETFPPGIAAVHLRNNLYPMVDNDVWMDLKGNVLKESVRDDLVVTLAEDKAKAKAELADAVLCRKDLVLDYSMIRITPTLEHPEKLQKLSVAMTGISAEFPLLQGQRQQATRLPDGRVIFTMPNPSLAPATGAAPTATDLEPAPRIPSDHPEILKLAREIAGGEGNPEQTARRLSQWVAREIKGSVTDSQSPLETLKSRIGNCQSHARLYASLARAAGIPTRFVSGVVYQGEGFLYHSWAESYLNNGWVPLDPTFGEFPANLSHVKLVEGDSLDEMGALAGVMGRVRATVLEKKY